MQGILLILYIFFVFGDVKTFYERKPFSAKMVCNDFFVGGEVLEISRSLSPFLNGMIHFYH